MDVPPPIPGGCIGSESNHHSAVLCISINPGWHFFADRRVTSMPSLGIAKKPRPPSIGRARARLLVVATARTLGDPWRRCPAEATLPTCSGTCVLRCPPLAACWHCPWIGDPGETEDGDSQTPLAEAVGRPKGGLGGVREDACLTCLCVLYFVRGT